MTWVTGLLLRPPIGWWDILDIVVVWILIYEVLKLIRGTRAVQMALGGAGWLSLRPGALVPLPPEGLQVLSPREYAVMVAIVSGLEVVLLRHAQRRGLLRETMPEEIFRWGAIQSLSPVAFFLLSVPLAFVSTTLAVVVWFGAIPFQVVSNRWKPPDADRYLAH